MKGNILLIRLSALGDIVLATSAIEMLYRQGFAIFFVTKRMFADVFRCDHRIKKLILLDSTKLKDLMLALNAIRKETFEAAFDLHFKLPSLVLLAFSKSKRKFLYNKRIFERRWAVLTHSHPKEMHTVELYLRPIRKFLKLNPIESAMPKLIPCNVKVPELPKRYGVLAPSAGAPTRVWPYFPEFCKLAKDEFGIPMVIVGKNEDIFAHDIARECEAIDMVGKTDIQHLMTVIKNAQFVVSNDSAPMHIASALNVPVIGIFGPTVPEFGMRPLGTRALAIEPQENLSCRPCSLHGEGKCKFGDPLCLKSITPEYVLKNLCKMLGNKRSF